MSLLRRLNNYHENIKINISKTELHVHIIYLKDILKKSIINKIIDVFTLSANKHIHEELSKLVETTDISIRH